MKTLSLRIPDKSHAWLNKRKLETGNSINSILRNLIEEYKYENKYENKKTK